MLEGQYLLNNLNSQSLKSTIKIQNNDFLLHFNRKKGSEKQREIVLFYLLLKVFTLTFIHSKVLINLGLFFSLIFVAEK